jgi:hypothetical protein
LLLRARACGNVKNLSLLTGYTVGGRRPEVMNNFSGHGFGPIPAPGSFACSAFPVPSEHCDLNDRLAVSEASFGRFGVSHKA